MQKIRCFNIKWDAPKRICKILPQSVVVEVSDEYDDEELSDKLSDATGFCMYSFNYETV